MDWVLETIEHAPGFAMALLLLGLILAASILTDLIGHRLKLPRISLLVLLGVGLALAKPVLPNGETDRLLQAMSEPLITIALVMVAFLLGGDLTAKRIKTTAKQIFIISLIVVGMSVLVVGGGLGLIGMPLALVLPLAAISAATDPAAVREVIREWGSNHGARERLLLGIVAIDDAWGIIVFGFAMAAVGFFIGGDANSALLTAIWELAGGIILGLLIGFPTAFLSGRLRPGEPSRAEALAVVLSIAGLSVLLEVSPLLAALSAGIVTANFSSHHRRSFCEIENIEWPFLIFFFVFAGATIDFSVALSAIIPVIAYIAFRLLGRIAGGIVGAVAARRYGNHVTWSIGVALTPQAGVAMGMALLAAEQYPETGPILVAVAACSTIFFEIVGPILTRYTLIR